MTHFYEKIYKLPKELKDVIESFIPVKISIFINKQVYVQNHSKVRQFIIKNQYENYIRAMIRRDNDLVFNLLFVENFERWLGYKKYVYKTTMFSNYIYFLLEYCIENDSDKCKQIINKYIEISGLSQNQHKKNTRRSIKWTH